jgi:RNA polymerase sigma factor (sigma-70 family)
MRQVLRIALWQAECAFDPALGIPRAAFLYCRLMARVLTRYRQEWRYGLHFHSPCADHPEASRAPIEATCEPPPCDDLADAMAALPEHSRRLILMLFWEERSEREVAEALGLSQPAIHKRKQCILGLLRRWLEARRL